MKLVLLMFNASTETLETFRIRGEMIEVSLAAALHNDITSLPRSRHVNYDYKLFVFTRK